jgi:hypothetical protein
LSITSLYFTTKNTKIAKINFYDRISDSFASAVRNSRIRRIKNSKAKNSHRRSEAVGNPINLVNPVEKSPLRLSASAGNATLSFFSRSLSNQKTDL